MAKWSNIEEWQKLCSGETCPICVTPIANPLGFIAELESSTLGSHEDGPMRGYCCLVFRRHAVDLHDLSVEEAMAFTRDVQAASSALKRITGAVKMNYEIHGNTIPHLHMHFYPRQVGDCFEGVGIDWRLTKKPVYQPGEFSKFVSNMRSILRTASET